MANSPIFPDDQSQSPNTVEPTAIRRACANLICILALFVFTVAGCKSQVTDDAMAGSYYLNPHQNLHNLGRVALVEMNSPAAYPEIAADITDALFISLQKQHIFGLTVVKLEGRDKNILKISGLDMLEGTPILDIKPYTMRELKENVSYGWLDHLNDNVASEESAD